MTYNPQVLNTLLPPINTTAGGGWQKVRANHNEVWIAYEPLIAQWAGSPFFTTTAGAVENMFRFRSRNGADFATGSPLRGLQMRVELMARRTNGGALTAVVSLAGGATTVQVNLTSTTFTKLTLTATPANDDEEWTIGALAALNDSVEISGLVAYWQPTTSPGTRAYPAGFRQAENQWDATNTPISTELVARLLDGPVCIAKDRPVCVFCHLWKADTDDGSFVKGSQVQDLAAWGVADSTQQVMVGRGRIPRADIRSRPYIVTYFLRSSGTASGTITIGASSYPVQADAWGSFQVELGPIDVDITASISATSVGEWAYFESVQVWRQAE